MNPDDYQKAWKTHSTQTQVTVNLDLLLQEVQRSHKNFQRMILWRDYREVVISALMIPMWIIMGFAFALPWTWYLNILATIWVATFTIIDRARHKQKPMNPNASLRTSVEESLSQLDHQIWLSRNVAWLQLLPYTITIQAFFIQTSFNMTDNVLSAIAFSTFCFVCLVALYGFVYYINQLVVKKQFVPQRQELVSLLGSLSDESQDAIHAEYPILMNTNVKMWSPRRFVIAMACAVALVALGAAFALSVDGRAPDRQSNERSPFTAVRWEDAEPEVNVNDEWYKLISINDVPASDIVAMSQRIYEDKWQQRFEENLVLLMSVMGHPPEDTVSLELYALASSEIVTLDNVPMTLENRTAIREAGQARRRTEPNRATHETIPAEEVRASTEPLSVVLESMRLEFDFPAMAAFVLREGNIVEQANVGTRTSKDDTAIGENARWHIGSNTKAMTATLAGILIEDGLLEWDSTIGEVLGGAIPNIHEDHLDTTLTMLFNHTSGITPNINWFLAPTNRIECAAKILKSRPATAKGEYVYSNAGYVIAGAMLEQVTGKRWEDLMVEKIFEPLDMKNTGFGAPTDPASPWGHRSGLLSWSPVNPSKNNSDNAPVVGPAGTVHTTLEDYSKFIAAHLAGARGKAGLVTAETFETLHTPATEASYALGWLVTDRGWAGGTALTHSGSNTMWYANVWIAPGMDMAFFAATNVGGDSAGKATNDVIVALIDRHIEPRTSRDGEGFARRAPYNAVRWEGTSPQVRIDNEWFTLVSIDDFPVIDIVEFCIANYDDRWQKRFEEDLVEVMTTMGHKPGDAVQLVVLPLDSQTPLTLDGVAMTEANRAAVREFAKRRSEN